MPTIDMKNPVGYNLDLDQLRAFEDGLDPRHPEQSKIPARVLGYGEISTVFGIDVAGLDQLAFKRLPIFTTTDELVPYLQSYQEYIRLLESEVGLQMPSHGYAYFSGKAERPVFYIIQGKVTPTSIGHNTLAYLYDDQILSLVEHLLMELLKVWQFNREQDQVQLAIDGQISNWAIRGLDDSQTTLPAEPEFLYLDTSTPLFRIQGEEQLNPELFLRSAPSFLRWLLRWLFLDDVVNRYYDFRLVTIDVIANFYKEQRPDLIPPLVEVANTFFESAGSFLELAPLTVEEIEAYYKEDALIWSLYLAMRRIDRTLHRLLGRHYPYILPGKIRR